MSGPAIQYHIIDGIRPEREVALVAALLNGVAPEEREAPFLVISRLQGEALSLGRYQRAETALTGQHEGPLVRRLTGGRACRYGQGQVSVCLIVPDLFSLTGARTADKTINRGVRGLLRAMGSLGLPALYGGRDMATVNKRPVAMVTMEALDNGVCLFQGIAGLEHHAAPDAAWVTAPPATGLGGAPWISLSELKAGLTFEGFAESLVDGYATATGRDMVAGSPPAEVPEAVNLASWEVDDYRWSAPVEVPIGVVEAGVCGTRGRISGASLCGDFIAASALVERLEEKLVGTPTDTLAVGRVVDGVFAGGHGILGLTSLAAIRDAILDAGSD